MKAEMKVREEAGADIMSRPSRLSRGGLRKAARAARERRTSARTNMAAAELAAGLAGALLRRACL
jgi:hypothetical protein